MTDILAQYGIKEVADITFFDLNADGTPGAPVLYIDSAKTTNLETTGEEAVAQGGKGNAELISWDHSRKGTFSISDALFSIHSLEVMTGAIVDDEQEIIMGGYVKGASSKPTMTTDGRTIPTGATFYDKDGKPVQGADYTNAVYAKWTVTTSDVIDITISPDKFPGTYYVTADTVVRSKKTGADESLQIILPKAKIQSNTTISLDAAGDPSVFDMTLKLLKSENGELVKIVKYTENAGA